MNRININCGNCSKSKGCEIKKRFRELAKTIEGKYYDIFKLKCPFKTRKFKDGDNVNFTIGINSYIQELEWECTWDSYHGDPCENCTNTDKCKDGIVIFKNKRYKDFVNVKGVIYNNYGHNKCIIIVDISELNKHKLNLRDSVFLQNISDKIIDDYNPIDRDSQIYIISREKYITIDN